MPTKDTIPLWLAAAITVVVSLPFGLWLGDWNLPLWIAFIVWAEYFALGAKPKVLTTIIPRSVKVSEAPGFGMTIIQYDPGSRGALTYYEAARELAERGTRLPPVRSRESM